MAVEDRAEYSYVVLEESTVQESEGDSWLSGAQFHYTVWVIARLTIVLEK